MSLCRCCRSASCISSILSVTDEGVSLSTVSRCVPMRSKKSTSSMPFIEIERLCAAFRTFSSETSSTPLSRYRPKDSSNVARWFLARLASSSVTLTK